MSRLQSVERHSFLPTIYFNGEMFASAGYDHIRYTAAVMGYVHVLCQPEEKHECKMTGRHSHHSPMV